MAKSRVEKSNVKGQMRRGGSRSWLLVSGNWERGARNGKSEGESEKGSDLRRRSLVLRSAVFGITFML